MAKRGPIPKNKLPAAKPDVGCAPVRSKESEAQERRWKAEDALRDIERAEGHKKDKALMADVKQVCAEKIDSLKRIK